MLPELIWVFPFMVVNRYDMAIFYLVFWRVYYVYDPINYDYVYPVGFAVIMAALWIIQKIGVIKL